MMIFFCSNWIIRDLIKNLALVIGNRHLVSVFGNQKTTTTIFCSNTYKRFIKASIYVLSNGHQIKIVRRKHIKIRDSVD